MNTVLKALAILLTLVVVGSIVAIIAIPHKREINQETEINASRQIVWEVLNDKSKYTEWQDAIKKVNIKDENNWTEITTNGEQEIQFKKTMSLEPEGLGLSYTMGDSMKGTWRGELKRLGPNKTLIRTKDTSEVNSAVSKVLMAVFFDYEGLVKGWNQKLKKRAEEIQKKRRG